MVSEDSSLCRPTCLHSDIRATYRFKIQEDGYSNGAWGTSKVIQNGGKHQIPIPSCLPDGEYLLRAEMIALRKHSRYCI
jgi:hypothetical protein